MHTLKHPMTKSQLNDLLFALHARGYETSSLILKEDQITASAARVGVNHLSAIKAPASRFWSVQVSLTVAKEQGLPLWSSSAEAQRVAQ